MPITGRLYRKMETIPSEIRSVLLDLVDEMDNSVKKEDFNELKEIVAELAEAQKRTEERVNELAEAQKKTEERLNELAEAQKKTEERLNELAEAQKKTEERLDSLTKRVEELAEAQKRTEEALLKLANRVDDIEDHLGGLSMVVGYSIEDDLYPYMNQFSKKVFNIDMKSITLRKFVEYSDGREDELNIFIEGSKDGKRVYLIGECKAQPGKKDIDRFVKTVERYKKHTGSTVFSFIVGYIFPPKVEKHIKELYPDLKFFKTYEIKYGAY